MFARAFSRVSKNGLSQCRNFVCPRQQKLVPNFSSNFHSLRESTPIQWIPSLHHSSSSLSSTNAASSQAQQRLWYSSTTPEPNGDNKEEIVAAKEDNSGEDNKESSSSTSLSESESDSDEDLSFDDLVKLVAEKEEMLKVKHREIEHMQDKVLRSYADMENIMDRTKREAENSKKFAIQTFAKSLLDVSDNLGRASSVVKESFSKLDTSKEDDDTGAVQLLKTLLEGVEMTEKQLAEVFKKYGLEKYEPLNEQFDPNKHFALFQIPDASKPPGTVAAVLKAGYMLHDRIIRPAEVGVAQVVDTQEASS